MSAIEDVQNICIVCHTRLNQSFILCAECKLSSLHRYKVCLKCFASGAETGTHKNNHKYQVIHDKIKLFPNTNWTAREDSMLLNCLERYGFANWSDIGRSMGLKSIACRDHYIENYFNGIFTKACNLPTPYNRIETPYLFRSNSLDPPRNKFDEKQNRFNANYRYARSEFDTSFDASAENIISGLHSGNEWSDDYRDISDVLDLSLVRAYNNRLRY